MTPTMWIGVGFGGALILFLMITFFVKDRSTPTQYNTLHFLTALCGGFAGALITGEALFTYNAGLPDGGKIAVSGTAGFALFFAVWLTYPKRSRDVLKDGFQISIPQGLTLENALRSIASITGVTVNLREMNDTALSAVLPAVNINSESAYDAFRKLQYQTTGIPNCEVIVIDDVYHIRLKGA